MTRTNRALALLLSAAAATACGDDTATAPDTVDQEVDAAVAALAADAALEDLAVMSDLMAPGPVGGPAAMGGDMGGRRDLVRQITVAFFDGEGAEQDGYDPLTTEAVHSVMTMEGQISRASFSATLRRQRDMWVTGLEGTETTRTWDGTGSESHSRTRVSDELGTHTYRMEATAEIDGVVRAVDRESQPWPLAGTITRTVTVTVVGGPHGDVTRTRTATLTFDGSRYALLVVDGVEYEVDLAARENDRSHRRRGG